MNADAKGVFLVAGTYVVTMVVAFLIVILAITILLMGSGSCSTMSRALLVLWTTIAVVFLVSIVVTGVVTRRFIAGAAGRLAIVIAYILAVLVSYIVIAFGLLVIFNC